MGYVSLTHSLGYVEAPKELGYVLITALPG